MSEQIGSPYANSLTTSASARQAPLSDPSPPWLCLFCSSSYLHPLLQGVECFCSYTISLWMVLLMLVYLLDFLCVLVLVIGVMLVSYVYVVCYST
jgi:hypothetical protein